MSGVDVADDMEFRAVHGARFGNFCAVDIQITIPLQIKSEARPQVSPEFACLSHSRAYGRLLLRSIFALVYSSGQKPCRSLPLSGPSAIPPRNPCPPLPHLP